MAKPPAPFALSDQYVKAVGRSEEPRVDEKLTPADPKASTVDGAPNGEDDIIDDTPKQWNYNEVRLSFIKNHQTEHGTNFAEAKAAWDNSSRKREYLGDVSIQELKRRKFLPKGADTNPWA